MGCWQGQVTAHVILYIWVDVEGVTVTEVRLLLCTGKQVPMSFKEVQWILGTCLLQDGSQVRPGYTILYCV